jgi:hypothetical protein
MDRSKRLLILGLIIACIGAWVLYNSMYGKKKDYMHAIQDLRKYEQQQTPIVTTDAITPPKVFSADVPVAAEPASYPHTGMRPNRYTLDDTYPCKNGERAGVQCGQIQAGQCAEVPTKSFAGVPSAVACQNMCWMSDPKGSSFFSIDGDGACNCYRDCASVACVGTTKIGGICGYRM